MPEHDYSSEESDLDALNAIKIIASERKKTYQQFSADIVQSFSKITNFARE
jgi:hypothetical protein